MTNTERAPIDAEPFLARFAQALAPLPSDHRRALVDEVRGHLAERGAAGQDALSSALAALGDPIDYARVFVEDAELVGALHRSSPARLLASLLARASRSLAVLISVTTALLLYAFALAFAAVAALKPIAPANVGAWTGPHLFAVGFLSAPPAGAVEHLGLWITPVALAIAVILYLAATRLMRWTGRRLLRAGAPRASR